MLLGRCIITYWRYGNWLGAVQCPVCRQIVSLMMRDFATDESEESREIESEINSYNRRFSGQPRPVSAFYIWILSIAWICKFHFFGT